MAKLTELAGRPLLAGAVMGGAVLTAAPIHPPLASADPGFSADEQAFINDVNAAGFVDDDGPRQAIKMGYEICSDLDSGVSEQREAIQIAQGSASTGSSVAGETDVSVARAKRFISIAVSDLCPQ